MLSKRSFSSILYAFDSIGYWVYGKVIFKTDSFWVLALSRYWVKKEVLSAPSYNLLQ